MVSYVLVLMILQGNGVSQLSIPGFTSVETCSISGEDWMGQYSGKNRNLTPFGKDVGVRGTPTFSCVPVR